MEFKIRRGLNTNRTVLFEGALNPAALSYTTELATFKRRASYYGISKFLARASVDGGSQIRRYAYLVPKSDGDSRASPLRLQAGGVQYAALERLYEVGTSYAGVDVGPPDGSVTLPVLPRWRFASPYEAYNVSIHAIAYGYGSYTLEWIDIAGVHKKIRVKKNPGIFGTDNFTDRYCLETTQVRVSNNLGGFSSDITVRSARA